MLTEDQINALPERIYERLTQINTEYLESIGKIIKKIGEIKPADVHKLQQAYNYGADMDTVIKKLSDVSEKNIDEIYQIFDIVASENYSYAKPFYEARGKKYVPYEDNIDLQRYVKSLARQTADEYVNLTQHTAFAVFGKDGKSIAPLFMANKDKKATSLSNTYTKIVDYAVSKVQLGQESYKSAMREVIEAMSESGIKTVDYATGYSRRLDSTVRQNILWGVKQCNQNTADFIGEEFGADGYEVSYHSNPRPSHEDMGGKQFAKGKARTVDGVHYPSFEVEAEPLLNEYNCLHFKFSIILGISRPAYDKKQLDQFKEADRQTFEFEGREYTKYEATQLQRRIETKTRHQWDLFKMAKAAGDDELKRKADSRIQLLTSKYHKLSQASGLPTRFERMKSAIHYEKLKKSDIPRNGDLFEARFVDRIINWPPEKGDIIKPKNIYNELSKSEVGKRAIRFIQDNNTIVDIYYGEDAAPDKFTRAIASIKGNRIEIYAHNTKTIKVTSETIIHEVAHIERKIGGSQWAEAVCFSQEAKHTKKLLTMSDLRDIIKLVKELYPEYRWR